MLAPTLNPSVLAQSQGTCLGSGVHRTGYRLTIGGTDFCVKVASYRGANKEEADGWEHVKGTNDEHLFAEVIAAAPDYSWLIMPFCQALASEGRPREFSSNEEAEEAGWAGGDYGWWFHEDFYRWESSDDGDRAAELTSDLHAFNVMRHPDGHIVVTDYGMGLYDLGGGDPWNGPRSIASASGNTCQTCAARWAAQAAEAASTPAPWPPTDSQEYCRASWRNELVTCPSCGWNIPVGKGRATRPVCGCSTCRQHRIRRQRV